MSKKKKCECCGEEASFFHSRCCGVHMEGVVTPHGELLAVCENCGKYVGTLTVEEKYKGKIFLRGDTEWESP